MRECKQNTRFVPSKREKRKYRSHSKIACFASVCVMKIDVDSFPQTVYVRANLNVSAARRTRHTLESERSVVRVLAAIAESNRISRRKRSASASARKGQS
jgi:hypothetical protein